MPSTKWWWRRRRALGAGGIAALFALQALESWRAWGDPVADFPAQLYMAWRISAGDVLFRDEMHFYGPLSQLLNGAWFKLVGPSYLALASLNLTLALAFTLAMFFMLARTFDLLTALTAAGAFVLIHVFQSFFVNSSFNFIGPYSHEATHGIFLLILQMGLAPRTRLAAGVGRWLACGALVGLSFLTKPEILLASTLMFCGQVLLAMREARGDRRRPLARALAAAAGGWLLAPLCSMLYFSAVGGQGIGFALRATAGAIYPLFTSDLASNPIYKSALGTDALAANLTEIVQALARAAGFFGIALGADLIKDARRRLLVGLPALAAMAVALGLEPQLSLVRAWPVLATAGLAWTAWRIWRGRLAGAAAALALALAIAAVVLTFKEYLHAGFQGTGFYLTALCTIFLVTLSTWTIPRALDQIRPGAFVFRWAAVMLFASLAYTAGAADAAIYALRNFPIGAGNECFFVMNDAHYSPSGAEVGDIIDRVRQRVPPGSTLLAIPEGAIVNYLLRLRNPTPYVGNFVAKTLYDAWGGGDKIVATLAASPPDFILYQRRMPDVPGPVYQMRGPGGFANQALDWIDAHYQEIDRLGPESDDFAKLRYVLLRRK